MRARAVAARRNFMRARAVAARSEFMRVRAVAARSEFMQARARWQEANACGPERWRREAHPIG
eukprot:6677216-Prymnesium_polylepis.1